MNVKIVCAGKMKDRYYIEAAAEYEKRLSRYASLAVAEVADEKTPDSLSAAEARQAVEKEGARLLAKIGAGEHAIALCIEGKRMTSEAFAAHLKGLFDRGESTVTFVIGGSLGLSPAVLARADEQLSLSDMTMPHRLCRVFLLEQIYRAFKINAHETYHK